MKILHILAAAPVFLMSALPASAHTMIACSNIEEGAELAAAPEAFEFSFGKEVGLASLELETSEGEAIDLSFKRPQQMNEQFSVPLPALETGSYVLKWRAVAKDGHVMQGEIDFTIAG